MFSATTLGRLSAELIVWMTTVDRNGQPQTSPVWFLWDDGTFWVYSLDPTARLDNIAANPRVSLNLNCDDRGSDIVTIEGTAQVDHEAPAANENAAFVARYRDRMERGWGNPEGFAAKYPTAIRITPTRVRQ
jgi:PPOX class probable F420-dependent enzyme